MTTAVPSQNATSTLDDKTREQLGAQLQPVLVDLLELALTGKQLHWNVVGPRFRAVHHHLDELVAAYRTWSDEVAERMSAIGIAPDGRVQRVAGDSPSDPAPDTWINDSDAVQVMRGRVQDAAARVRERVRQVDDLDPGSGDLLMGILRGLEEQLWMLDAQLR